MSRSERKKPVPGTTGDFRSLPAGILIDLWREISPNEETGYLLSSETMRRRLLEARDRQDGIAYEVVRETGLEFDRLVYQVFEAKIRILACRYHY